METDNLRVRALELALEAAKEGEGADAIVARAEAFIRFLASSAHLAGDAT